MELLDGKTLHSAAVSNPKKKTARTIFWNSFWSNFSKNLLTYISGTEERCVDVSFFAAGGNRAGYQFESEAWENGELHYAFSQGLNGDSCAQIVFEELPKHVKNIQITRDGRRVKLEF